MAAILIVDDEKNIREHLALYISILGHAADTAPDATAALAKLDEKSFDIVISDVSMAGMNGLSLLREIRRRQPEVSVVLMTAYATVPQAVEAMRAGAFEYLMKPFAPDDVRLLINHLLDVQALTRAPAPAHAHDTAARSADADLPLKGLERRRTEQVLAEAPTLEVAARRLGIHPATLWRKRKRWGLDHGPQAPASADDASAAISRNGAKK